MIGESVTIKNITKDTVITSNGTFRIQSALKPLFNTSNKTALSNARATIVVKNGQITDVTALILNKAGTSKNLFILMEVTPKSLETSLLTRTM